MAYQMGIDLGTTYSSVAVAQAGRVEMLGLGNRSSAIPSVVLVEPSGEILVGDAAEAGASREPTRVARQFKRRLGDPTPLFLGGVPYSTEALSGILLRNLYERTVARMGEAPSHIVITHPAVYSNYKLDLLRDAARQAGLANAVLLPEPSAAAIEYASIARVEPGEVIGVYDFGGGTFDAALVRRTPAGFELLGEPQGLERLGGVDFDQAVLEHVRDRLGDPAGLDADDPATLAALARLRADSRHAKEMLSEAEAADIPVIVPGLTTSVPITRPELESMIRPRLAEPLTALRRAIDSAGLQLDDVTRIVLIGGSSRIPIVRRELERALGRTVSVDADPEAFVARGAARYAATLAVPPVAVPPPPPPPPPPVAPPPTQPMPVGPFVASPPPPAPSRRPWWILGAVLAVAVVGVVVAVLLSGGDDETASTTTEAVSTTAARPTTTAAAPTTVAPTTATTTATTTAPTTTVEATTTVATTIAPTTVAPTQAPTTAATTTIAAAPATTINIGVGNDQPPPPMPTAIEGFAPSGAPVETQPRAFDNGSATIVDAFPVTMNGCDQQFFTVRWQAAERNAQVLVGTGDVNTNFPDATPIDDLSPAAPASAGYWSGDGCQQPAFGLVPGSTDLMNIRVEYQIWTPSLG